MKVLVALAALAGVATAAGAGFPDNSLLELGEPKVQQGTATGGQVPSPATGPLATFVPESDPWDNAATDTKMIPTIPSSPQCTVRGQTVFEIRKMRADAKQIGMAIMYEIQTMEKRKAYIERMTLYLNDRIRELNKVKHDLAAEQKWIDVSNQRIAELAQREKLIKLQDVMECIKDEQDRLANERGTKAFTVQSLESQAQALKQNIDSIRLAMNNRLNDRHNVTALHLGQHQQHLQQQHQHDQVVNQENIGNFF